MSIKRGSCAYLLTLQVSAPPLVAIFCLFRALYSLFIYCNEQYNELQYVTLT